VGGFMMVVAVLVSVLAGLEPPGAGGPPPFVQQTAVLEAPLGLITLIAGFGFRRRHEWARRVLLGCGWAMFGLMTMGMVGFVWIGQREIHEPVPLTVFLSLLGLLASTPITIAAVLAMLMLKDPQVRRAMRD
jgi:hypothetical protein